MQPEFLAFLGLAWSVGVLCGFGLWDFIDRTKWAAYRAVYRRFGGPSDAKE